MTAHEITRAIQAGEKTALDVLEYFLDQIRRQDPQVGAFLEVFEQSARAQAQAVDEKHAKGEPLGRLAGVPVALKDNMLITGCKATAGSKMLEEYTAAYDATVVERLRKADAIFIGRTNMDEFAMGSSTQTSAWQTTRNPHNLKKNPGGSSGGSAAAVSAGMVPIALGSDTGGSIRQPASLCGVFGLKPSYGRVSRYGLIAFSSSLDQIGVFATTAQDVARTLEVIEGLDERDSTTEPLEEVTVGELLDTQMKGVRVGVPKEYFTDDMDQRISTLVKEGIEKMKQAGAEIVEVSLPLTDYALGAYYIIQPAEASSNLARFDGMRYGTRAQADTLLESYRKARGEGFGAEVKRRIMMGTFVLSAGYYDAYYKKALQVRQMIKADFDRVFADVDIIAGPTSPCLAWDLGEKFEDPIAMYMADVFTVSANIAGLPAISVPCGQVDGLPVGLQFLAKSMQDDKILHMAHAFEHLDKS